MSPRFAAPAAPPGLGDMRVSGRAVQSPLDLCLSRTRACLALDFGQSLAAAQLFRSFPGRGDTPFLPEGADSLELKSARRQPRREGGWRRDTDWSFPGRLSIRDGSTFSL